MQPIQDLIDFCLKDREDAADWKDDSSKFISLARRAQEGLKSVKAKMQFDNAVLQSLDQM